MGRGADSEDHLKNASSLSLLSCAGAGRQNETGDIFVTNRLPSRGVEILEMSACSPKFARRNLNHPCD